MASTEATKAEQKVTTATVAAKTVQAEPKFTIEKLREGSKAAFKVEVEVFDGAFHGKTGEFTRNGAQKIILDFLNKEVR